MPFDVVPEKHSSSSAKAARSTMLEVKQEPQTMAENKKRKSEERSPPKVPPKKSEAEMPKKKKDKDKVAPGHVSLKVLPWVVDGAGGLGAGKTSGAGTRGVDLNAAIGGRTGDSNTNGGESSNNRSKIHVECYPAENPSL